MIIINNKKKILNNILKYYIITFKFSGSMLGVDHSHRSLRTFSSVNYLDLTDEDISKTFLASINTTDKDKLITSDRRVFIFYQFITDHPDTLVENFAQVNYLINEKSSFRKWKTNVYDQWTLLKNVPEWLVNETELRDIWIAEYHDQLITLRLEQMKTTEENNKARNIFEQSVKRNNELLSNFEDQLYKDNPVILIHKITPSALPEADILKLHELDKEERRQVRKDLVEVYKRKLLKDFRNGNLSLEELINLTK